MTQRMVKKIINDGWRILPVDEPQEFLTYRKGQRVMHWHVVGPDDKVYSVPFELRKIWKNWRAEYDRTVEGLQK